MFIPNEKEMELFIEDALKKIIEVEDFYLFLHWMQNKMGVTSQLSLIPHQDDNLKAVATNMALSLWNITPLPGNKFKPKPIPLPKRNDPCVCGSGKKYKKCCWVGNEQHPALETESIWPILLEILPVKTLQKAIKNGMLPLAARIQYCEQLLTTGEFKKIIDILEPYYQAKSFTTTNEMAGFGSSILCDAYDGLLLFEEKIRLLDHLCQNAPASALRSDALQRRASIYADTGELDKAFSCVKKARKDTPKDKAVGLLEVQLLLMADKDELAVNRARFLYKQVQREMQTDFDEEENPMLGFLELVIDSPADAKNLLQPGKTGKDIEIAEWIAQNSDRPPVPYPLTELEGLAPNTPEIPGFGKPHFTLETPEKILDLEDEWREICPITPLFSTQLFPMPTEFPWEDDCNVWQDFLLSQPEVLDSLLVIDDLLTIFQLHPFADDTDFIQQITEPVLERALMLIKTTLKKLPQNGCLPWIVPENRPLLRILVRQIEHEAAQGKNELIRKIMEQLMTLNPHDNHGIRGELVNLYLHNGEYERALEITKNYPDDIFSEILYGRVLALYQLGRKDEALKAARKAKNELPLVASYLVSPKRTPPKDFSPFSVTYGSKEEAFLYRQEMRDIWKSTRGALALLKKA